MALGPRAISLWSGGLGGLAAALVAGLVLGTLALVLAQAGPASFSAWDWAAIRFTVLQAGLSALISVALAVPLARALARRRFVGRGVLITALGAPFLLPTIVAVIGLLAIFGRSGVLNDGLRALGLEPVSIYGLQGVVLAHVFFNLPLATRMILQGWQTIPSERLRLAASLGFAPQHIFRHIERPMLATVLPGAVLAVFLICLTSFAVALILGGGPRATTVELAIYQAIRFDFDLPRAAMLALVQVGLCVAAVSLAARFALPAVHGAGLDRAFALAGPNGWRRGVDAAVITLAMLFLLLPLIFVALNGVSGLFQLGAPVWFSAVRSVAVALTATGLTLLLALPLGHLALVTGWPGRLAEGAAMLPLAASGLVLGTGLFLTVFPFANPQALALPVLVVVNAALALPFAFRLILPALRDVMATQGRLALSLGMTPWQRLRLVTLPRLRRPLGFAAGLAAALSMGDLGAITLFAGPGSETLPLQVWRLMGSYRTAEAEGAALLLVVLSFALFAIFDHWGRRDADA